MNSKSAGNTAPLLFRVIAKGYCYKATAYSVAFYLVCIEETILLNTVVYWARSAIYRHPAVALCFQ